MCVTTGSGRAIPVTTASEDAAPRQAIPLEQVDQVTVTTLVDNVTDLLAADAGPARRPFIGDAVRGPSALFEDGWTYEGLIAEHGFSALVMVTAGGTRHQILFDAGLSPDALVTNMRRLGIDPGGVEAVVLSHGHSDHTTGLDGFIRAVGRASLPVPIHPDFWNRRRLLIPGRDPVELPTTSRKALEGAGFTIVEVRQPSLLLDGSVLITGRWTAPPASSPGSRRSRRCAAAGGNRTRWCSMTRRSSSTSGTGAWWCLPAAGTRASSTSPATLAASPASIRSMP